jgi:Ca2+-binding RTX toxin-like protein
MRRTILTMATTMTLAVLVIGGVAWALTFTCTLDNCIGTPQDDQITGADRSQFFDARAGNDAVQGRGDNDTIHGRSGFDDLTGDGANDPTLDGQDFMFGEGRRDFLEGEGGINQYFGGSGPDIIDAQYSGFRAAADEEIHGGRGNDNISTDDGLRDNVECGSGPKDIVHHDQFDVLAANCELRLGPG